ncbi:HD domain-containing protein [Bacillus andreraoultii]|uniref:HD domain-containing protein n=1 Tax=Bacillus andreraoultii TaxID=1499685 RepID=UPI00053A8F41|nr:HD domain-containing protein [Bacillus andreraoultii]
MSIVEKAIEIAAKAHDHQYRKTSKLPYIIHPFSVGILLLQHGYSDIIVAAGILHDTVEDTELTLDEIKLAFGETIAHIVRGASEENKQLSWEERKQATLDHLPNESYEVCLVVCADKLHNIRSIRRELEIEGEKVWNRFNRGRDKQAWYYRGIVRCLREKLDGEELFSQLAKEVEEVFTEKAPTKKDV